MVFDLEQDGTTILTGSRVLAGEPLIPYEYLEAGNFILLTINDELPSWKEFGATQKLIYLTGAEIEAIKNGETGSEGTESLNRSRRGNANL